MKIDHIGIAVEDAVAISKIYEEILQTKASEPEELDGMKICFVKTGESNIEFIQPLDPETAIGKFLEKKGTGIHHIAFATDNIEKTLEHLKSKGYELIDKVPRNGAHGAKIAFAHPKSSGKILIEFCQR